MIKYYVKRGTEVEKELYEEYKIYVIGNKGLNDCPTPKEEYVESFADTNGQKAYERLTKVYEPQSVEIDFLAVGELSVVKANVKSLITYLETVVPAFEKSVYGSSSFEIRNELWNETKELRYLGFEDDAKLTPKTVKDISDPKTLKHGYFFTLKFVIDNPTL